MEYLRCDIKTEMEKICLALFGVWNMPMPNLIMRMMGDPASTLSVRMEKELLRGISDAAEASGRRMK